MSPVDVYTALYIKIGLVWGVILFLVSYSYFVYRYVRDHENFVSGSDNIFHAARLTDFYPLKKKVTDIKIKALRITLFVFISTFCSFLIGSIVGVVLWAVSVPFLIVYGGVLFILSWKEKITIDEERA